MFHSFADINSNILGKNIVFLCLVDLLVTDLICFEEFYDSLTHDVMISLQLFLQTSIVTTPYQFCKSLRKVKKFAAISLNSSSSKKGYSPQFISIVSGAVDIFGPVSGPSLDLNRRPF